MERPSARFIEVNPYAGRVYEHPEVLLPHPEPAMVRARVAEWVRQARDQAPHPRRGSPRLVMDLGCGSGNFLRELAVRRPEDLHLGFELRFKRLVRGAEKLEKQGASNVWLLRELGERFAAYVPPNTLDRVHVNFPDPWPRRGDWKKRMINPDFLDDLTQTLRPGGRFQLKTDHSGYFLHVLAVIQRHAGLRLGAWSNDLNRWDAAQDAPHTEFEGLFRAKRKPIFYLELEKP